MAMCRVHLTHCTRQGPTMAIAMALGTRNRKDKARFNSLRQRSTTILESPSLVTLLEPIRICFAATPSTTQHPTTTHGQRTARTEMGARRRRDSGKSFSGSLPAVRVVDEQKQPLRGLSQLPIAPVPSCSVTPCPVYLSSSLSFPLLHFLSHSLPLSFPLPNYRFHLPYSWRPQRNVASA